MKQANIELEHYRSLAANAEVISLTTCCSLRYQQLKANRAVTLTTLFLLPISPISLLLTSFRYPLPPSHRNAVHAFVFLNPRFSFHIFILSPSRLQRSPFSYSFSSRHLCCHLNLKQVEWRTLNVRMTKGLICILATQRHLIVSCSSAHSGGKNNQLTYYCIFIFQYARKKLENIAHNTSAH